MIDALADSGVPANFPGRARRDLRHNRKFAIFVWYQSGIE
jgi:hypothetical protein